MGSEFCLHIAPTTIDWMCNQLSSEYNHKNPKFGFTHCQPSINPVDG